MEGGSAVVHFVGGYQINIHAFEFAADRSTSLESFGVSLQEKAFRPYLLLSEILDLHWGSNRRHVGFIDDLQPSCIAVLDLPLPVSRPSNNSMNLGSSGSRD